jgi:hypothetical protein
MIPNSHVIRNPYGLKGSGKKNAINENKITHNGNNFVTNLKNFSTAQPP